MKIAVVTALIEYNGQKTDEMGRIKKMEGIDYILFTNDVSPLPPGIVEEWEVREIHIPGFLTHSLYAVKSIKWNLSRYLPDYDIAVWVDCCYSPSCPPHYQNELRGWIRRVYSENDLPIVFRTQGYPCVQEDMNWCLQHDRISEETHQQTQTFLIQQGYSPHTPDTTLWSSCIIMNLKSPRLHALSLHLLQWIYTTSYREQHWLPCLMTRHGLRFGPTVFLSHHLFRTTGKLLHNHHNYRLIPTNIGPIRKILIENAYVCHLETIESIMMIFVPRFYPELVVEGRMEFTIHLHSQTDNEKDFQQYLTAKYDFCTFLHGDLPITEAWDLVIHATVYSRDWERVQRDPRRWVAIIHTLQNEFVRDPRVYFLSPFSRTPRWFLPSLLPALPKTTTTSSRPVFLIQSNDPRRRDFESLVPVLERWKNHDFEIRILGRYDLPAFLTPYLDKITHFKNLLFRDFHAKMNGVKVILPLITKPFAPPYFKTKLSSSISYGVGYGFLVLCPPQLAQIYSLPHYLGYETTEELVTVFGQALHDLQ